MKIIVTKNDWKTSPMPEQNTAFFLNRVFSDEQMRSLKVGHVPQSMDDRWFWYFENDKLFAHRSWTGFCIYIIEFNTTTWIHTVTVNRDDAQYFCKDLNEDIFLLNMFLDCWSRCNA